MNHVRINEKDKVIVVGVGLKSEPVTEIKENLCELEELVTAAGGEVIGSTVQILHSGIPARLSEPAKFRKSKKWPPKARRTL